MYMTTLMNPKFELFAFFEMTPDLVCIAGRDGFFKKVNPVVIDKLGYSEKELFSKPIATFIYEEDREVTRKLRTTLLDGKVLHNFVNRYVTKTGDVLWLEWTSIYFADNETVFAVAKDISKRKQLEKEADEKYKKFKNLATYFKSSIEKDRKYLTYELHEELAQLVAVVKMDIDLVACCETDMAEASKKRIEHALGISNLLIKTLQRISFTISPYMLEELGLNATLEWLCREFSILNGIPCSFKSGYDVESLTPEIKTDFFRICQESLSNVIDHAKASGVKIGIDEKDDKIRLTIVDDGEGFDITQQKKTPGLTSMRERADSINGELTIFSETGVGTTVCFTIAKQYNDPD